LLQWTLHKHIEIRLYSSNWKSSNLQVESFHSLAFSTSTRHSLFQAFSERGVYYAWLLMPFFGASPLPVQCNKLHWRCSLSVILELYLDPQILDLNIFQVDCTYVHWETFKGGKGIVQWWSQISVTSLHFNIHVNGTGHMHYFIIALSITHSIFSRLNLLKGYKLKRSHYNSNVNDIHYWYRNHNIKCIQYTNTKKNANWLHDQITEYTQTRLHIYFSSFSFIPVKIMYKLTKQLF